jgi:transcriptional regulator GlxA family with amidase domain
MHLVTVVAVPPVGTFELAIPDLVFPAVGVDGPPAYQVQVCAAEPGRVASTGGLDVFVPHGLDRIRYADTVIVSGTGARQRADPRVLDALRRAAAGDTRIASICTGAFVLAQAGLLDGRRATTHWRYAAELAERFPAVHVAPDLLFVQDGNIVTSAGLASGLDMCLHLVRADHGAAVANDVARLAVVAPVRPGGQTQFVGSPLPVETGTSLAGTRAWALDRLDAPVTLADLARHAHTSIRTLTRRFRAETGLSPLQWLLQQRVERARELLEASDLPLTQVARLSGLGSVDSLRQHVRSHTGLHPSAYRRSFTRGPAEAVR